MKFHNMYLIASTLFLNLVLTNITNYINYGSFELPAITAYPGWLIGSVTEWTGQYFDLINDVWLGRGQALDLQRGIGQNGYIEQIVTLQDEGYCNLSFYQQAMDTNYNSYVLTVYWNGILVVRQSTNTTLPTFHSFTICGMLGNNSLRFQEVGLDTDYFGMIIDEISLTCDGATLCMNNSV